MKAIIIEDVHDNIDTLKYLLSKSIFEVDVVGIADNLTDAKELLKLKSIDVAFLDIQLKDGIIFDLLEEVRDEDVFPFQLVFTTAFSTFEMAIKAIQFACLDYLTKPLQEEKLHEVLKKVIEKNHSTQKSDQLSILLDAVKENYRFPKSFSVALPKGVVEIIDVDSVQYFNADGNTCILDRGNDKKLHSVKTFAYFLELFSGHPDFIQINRSQLVNKSKVKRYNHRSKELTLEDGKALIVSHRMSSSVKEVFNNASSPFGKLRDILGM